MDGELAALEGGGDADLDAEFVGLVRLAFANAFDLGSVQAVDLGAALAAFLREHAVCEDKQPCELRLQPRVVFDFADDIANDAAETGLELAQRAVGALELAGMGIALVHDERELADPLVVGAA